MASSLHGSAQTTSQFEPNSKRRKKRPNTLAQRFGLSRTDVNKWRSRTITADAPMGPTAPCSTVLTRPRRPGSSSSRRRTLLPPDDVLGCLRDSIPNLTRSSPHRCLTRHGISRLPENPDQASKRGKFADATIGFVHIELRLAQGKLIMFLAIDRVSRFTCVAFREDAGKMDGADFLLGVVSAYPYAIHTVLTDNGMAFADLPKNRGRHPAVKAMFSGHIFDHVCKQQGIQNNLTKHITRGPTARLSE